jgi:hypothetical protein
VSERGFFGGRHRFEVLRDLEALVQDFKFVHAGDGCGDAGNTHRVAQGFFGGDHAFLQGVGCAAEGLHAEDSHVAARGFGHDLLLEAVEVGVEGAERHLNRVKLEAGLDHLEVDGRVFVTGEAEVANLAFPAGLFERPGCAAREDKHRRVIVKSDAVDLP